MVFEPSFALFEGRISLFKVSFVNSSFKTGESKKTDRMMYHHFEGSFKFNSHSKNGDSPFKMGQWVNQLSKRE